MSNVPLFIHKIFHSAPFRMCGFSVVTQLNEWGFVGNNCKMLYLYWKSADASKKSTYSVQTFICVNFKLGSTK